MNPNEILDYFLRLIYIDAIVDDTFPLFVFEREYDEKVGIGKINDHFNVTNITKANLSENIKAVLDKLTKDGYLDQKPTSMPGSSITYYTKNFEGKWFIYADGYHKIEKDRGRDKQKLMYLEVLTVLVGLSTVLTAIHDWLNMPKKIQIVPALYALLAVILITLVLLILLLTGKELQQQSRGKQ